MKQYSRDQVDVVVGRIREKSRQWGITTSFLAAQLKVTRQYIWQVLHSGAHVSAHRAREMERSVDSIIRKGIHTGTFGKHLRAARIAAGLTLKQVGQRIGYSWVGVQRWEKDVCLPKPGVLWHLYALYGFAQEWIVPPGEPGNRRRSIEIAAAGKVAARGALAELMRVDPVLLFANPSRSQIRFLTQERARGRQRKRGAPAREISPLMPAARSTHHPR